jgi:hypothetical protein
MMINILTFIQEGSSNPAVVMVVVMALDIHGYLLHVVVVDRVHLVWHVYDVMFAEKTSD